MAKRYVKQCKAKFVKRSQTYGKKNKSMGLMTNKKKGIKY
jgi:hypothetical protein